MKLTFKVLLTLLPLCYSMLSFADDEVVTNVNYSQNCSLEYRPNNDEIAVVATGAPLISAHRKCERDYLLIPHDQDLGAVTLLKGRYFKLSSNKENYIFRAVNEAGDRIQSCLWCDRIERLMLKKEDPHALCVLSYLNVRSCAITGSVDFSVEHAILNSGEVCVPSLAYYGRQGNILRFAVNDCKNITLPSLTYDLSLGNVVRFLDERIEILRADNNGIRFRRLKKELQNND